MTTNRGDTSPKFFVATIAALLRKISEADRRNGALQYNNHDILFNDFQIHEILDEVLILIVVLVYVVNNDAKAGLYEEPYLLSGVIPILTHYTNQSKAIQKIANSLLEYRSNQNVDIEQFIKSKGFNEREASSFRRFHRVNPHLELDYGVLGHAIDLDPELQHYEKQSYDYIFAMQACNILLKGTNTLYCLI